MMHKVSLNLNFAGVMLPVAQDDQGRDIVPLKPISDIFGLQWSRQKKKFGIKDEACGVHMYPAGPEKPAKTAGESAENGTADEPKPPYLARRLGLCLAEFNFAGQSRQMLAIRLDRVAAYLYRLNPEQVRTGGNVDGADFLQQKQEEWDDVLHQYESAEGIMSRNERMAQTAQIQAARALLSAIKEKRVSEDPQQRLILEQLIQSMARKVGISYQPDMLDQGKTK